MTSPYADSAHAYLAAGWAPLPLPLGAKCPPPEGWTGADGARPSYADVQTWLDEDPDRNIAVRLPPTVVGVDVDAYDGKPGAETWRLLNDTEAGPFPATFRVGSRLRVDSTSGIRLYRLPDGVDQADLWGAHGGVDLLRFGHRYAVAPPSVHPSGSVYAVLDDRTGELVDLPAVDDLPELPASLARLLTQAGAPWAAPEGAGRLGTDTRAPCPPVARLVSHAFAACQDSSRHDTVRDDVAALVRLDEQGHHGVTGGLRLLRAHYVDAVSDRDDELTAGAEYDRMVTGARDLVAKDPTPPERRGCCPVDTDAEVAPLDSDEQLLDPLLRQAVVDLERRHRARVIVAEREARRHPKPAPDVATLAELLARPVEQRWRVDGLLPAGGRLLLSAQRKTGKTTAVGNLAASMLTGEAFLDRFPTTPIGGNVVVLNYEVTGETFAAWMADIGMPADRLVAVNLRGRRNLLADQTGRAELVDLIRERDGQVLVVDPFGRAFTGKSQNDAAEVTPWLVQLDEVAEAAGCAELVLTAHAGWDGERTRGSSALEDWPDAFVTLTRDPDTDARFLRAEGRDVDVDEDELRYDPRTRRVTMTGRGSRREVRSAARLDGLVEAVVGIVEAEPGVNVAGILTGLREAGHHVQKGDHNQAAALAVERGRVRREQGPRRSWLHFPTGFQPKTPTSPESPPGLVVSSPDPSYRDGATTGVTEGSSSPGADSTPTQPQHRCRDCGETVPDRHTLCAGCAQAVAARARLDVSQEIHHG